ncbi:hypothetical protein [Paraburkholderia bannensis]|uniref:hypothetical protein n=1 Tax=Paraburkholderia bannensis TaxID=765414 RepID=UPI000ADE87B9|nr:hypothetical protein [Paraburkholderia bannensis]
MQASQTPTLVPLAFAANGTKNTIPEASQITVTPGAASLNDGFPPLTFTPVAAGGVPPFGADFNGILNLITASIRWAHGGGRYAYSSAFVADANVGGYPQGAVLMSADLQGSWLSLNDSNTDNPDTGAGTKWVPQHAYGATAITGLTNTNVTLTPAQAMKKRITLAGTLTANVQIIFPTWVGEWNVVNNTTGAFSVTAKTASGGGLVLAPGQQKVTGDGTNITQPSESIASATSIQQAVNLAQLQAQANGAAGATTLSANTTLTAASAGQIIRLSAGAQLTLPVASTMVTQGLKIVNYGAVPATVVTQSTDVFVNAGSTPTTITLQPGDDLRVVARAPSTSTGWDLVDGSALRQFNPLVVAAATANNHAPQMSQVAGVVGSVRNFAMTVSAAAVSNTPTADEIVVETALGGIRYCLSSFSKTINLATTGAGGMDTGSAPASGFVALYAIYNPSNGASALLATNATSAAAPSVYGGANMPSGYTASALVSVWPTNASSQLIVGVQRDRAISIVGSYAVQSTSPPATFTSLSLSSIVPKNAVTVSGQLQIKSTSTSTMAISIASDVNGSGQQNLSGYGASAGSSIIDNFADVLVASAQTLYYSAQNSSGTPTASVYINGYKF